MRKIDPPGDPGGSFVMVQYTRQKSLCSTNKGFLL